MAVTMIRTIIIYISLVISMRIMGKRQLGELEPADLVVAVLISDLASHPLQDPGIPLLYGLIPVATLLCCEVLISAGVLKSVRFRSIICGRPSVLIKNGVINQMEMKKNRFTVDELAEELRKKEITDFATVKYAILETDGTVSTVLFPSERPVTAGQLNINVNDSGYPVIVINNGRLLEENLKSIGKNSAWLRKELKKKGITDHNDVYIMTVDAENTIYLSQKEKD